MCPTCQLPIYQLRFFYQELHPLPLRYPRLEVYGFRFTFYLLLCFLRYRDFLETKPGCTSWQMNRDNSESGRSCVHLVCQKKTMKGTCFRFLFHLILLRLGFFQICCMDLPTPTPKYTHISITFPLQTK